MPPPNFSAVKGSGLDAATLVGFKGRELISRCGAIDIFVTVADPGELDATLGANVTLTFEAPPPYELCGVARDVEVLHEMTERSLARITIVPRLWLLSLSAHSRMFTGETIPDIIKKVLEESGLADGTDFELRLSGSYEAEEHVCQYHESDLDFIQRWSEHEGIYYFFEHADGVDKVVFCDDSSGAASMASAALRYHPAGGSDRSAGASLWRFSAQHSSRAKSVTLGDYDYARPSMAVTGEGTGHASGFADKVLFGDDRFFDPGRGKALAAIRAEEELCEQALVRATGDASHLRPGYTFELTEHPVGKLNTTYLVIDVHHVANITAKTAEVRRLTGLPEDETYKVRLSAIPAATKYRPARVTPRPRVEGYLTGIVDGAADSDYAQLDKEGRYNIMLHLDESGLDSGKASTRLRMMQPHAGAPEGMHFPLRKGTEVIVACLDGDPDRPLIVGAVPNPTTPSPVTSDNHTHNIIHTGGDNILDFEDIDGGQWITFSTPTEDTFYHLGKPTDDRTHHITMHTDGNNLFEFGAEQDIIVGGTLDETVEGPVKELYKAKQTSLIFGSQTTTVSALCKETYENTQFTLTLGSVTEDYQVPHTSVVNAAPRNEVFLSSQTMKVSGGGADQNHKGAHTRILVGPNVNTLDSFNRHVTGSATEIYPSGLTRVAGPIDSTFKSLKLIIPGGVTEIWGQKEESVPSLSIVNLLQINQVGMKKECAFLQHGGCVFKLGATGAQVSGIAINTAAGGVAIGINGFKHEVKAVDMELPSADEIKLDLFTINI